MYYAFAIDKIYRPSAEADFTLRILEEAENEGGEVFECLRTMQQIRPGNREDYYTAWYRIAEETEKVARDAEGKAHLVTARRAYLRAYNYYRLAHFHISLSDKRKVETYRKSHSCFQNASKLFVPPFEYIEVDYEGSKLEGILFPPVRSGKTLQSGKAPLVIYIGGVDSQKEESYFLGGRDATERGMNVLAIDGPGQGSAVFLRGIACTHEFEKPVGKFIDALAKKEGIDLARIALVGRSLGGYFAPRVAAFDSRIKACVAWGAVYEFGQVSEIPSELTRDLLGAKNDAEALERMKKYTLKGVVSRIRCPLLVVQGEADTMSRVDQAQKIYDEATCEKELKIFKLGEPGAGHCNHDAPSIAFPLVFDWIQDKLK
jgi:dipeptidyl aminopeptidase/acylaminoacyl peptidase